MTDDQFERLIEAINRNTETQAVVAEAMVKLADECVTLATMLADPDAGADPGQEFDMAGRPIG